MRAVINVTFPTYQIGEVFQERYKITGKLGSGGMGIVYSARQLYLGRDVAIKLVPLTARSATVDLHKQFALESQAIAGIEHENIVKVFDGGITSDGVAYIVMERLEGVSLRSMLLAGRIAELRSCLILGQVAQALYALHSVPMLHRDIKPENMMVLAKDETKIVDFGLARVRTASKYATRNPNVAGTLHYMPREQLMGDPLDEKVDIFAFGLVLFECFAGAHPRATESGTYQNRVDVIRSVADAKPLQPLRLRRPDLPPALLDLYERCVALESHERPNAFELVQTFATVTAHFAYGRPGATHLGVGPATVDDRRAQGSVRPLEMQGTEAFPVPSAALTTAESVGTTESFPAPNAPAVVQVGRAGTVRISAGDPIPSPAPAQAVEVPQRTLASWQPIAPAVAEVPRAAKPAGGLDAEALWSEGARAMEKEREKATAARGTPAGTPRPNAVDRPGMVPPTVPMAPLTTPGAHVLSASRRQPPRARDAADYAQMVFVALSGLLVLAVVAAVVEWARPGTLRRTARNAPAAESSVETDPAARGGGAAPTSPGETTAARAVDTAHPATSTSASLIAPPSASAGVRR